MNAKGGRPPRRREAADPGEQIEVTTRNRHIRQALIHAGPLRARVGMTRFPPRHRPNTTYSGVARRSRRAPNASGCRL